MRLSRILLLVVASTILRLLVAGLTELGNDEVYYWTYSQHLQWNYFDHPPLVAIWIRAATGNLLLEHSELFVRLGSILSAALCTLLIYRITTRLHSERAGWFAACLYSTSLYASIIAGTFILPDSPQVLFWCLSLYALARITETPRSWTWWLLFGLCTGLCIMSKVHGGFLWIGLGFYILLQHRHWLRLPQLYVAALLTAVLISPILLWNLQNDFITYRFHSERVEVHGFHINPGSFLRELLGSFFYNNPFNVVILLSALVAWRRQRIATREPLRIYAWIALPLIGLLLLISLFRTTFPHWSGPGYVTLLPLSGIYLSTVADRRWPRRLGWAAAFIIGVVAVGLALIFLYPGTMGSRKEESLGKGDFTLDLHGWTAAGKEFAAFYRADLSAGKMPAGAPLVAQKWFPAAHEEYYFCRPLGISLIGLGTEYDLHQYLWRNTMALPQVALDHAYAVVPSNLAIDVQETYGSYYRNIEKGGVISTWRNGGVMRLFTIYRLSGRTPKPAPVLHEPGKKKKESCAVVKHKLMVMAMRVAV